MNHEYLLPLYFIRFTVKKENGFKEMLIATSDFDELARLFAGECSAYFNLRVGKFIPTNTTSTGTAVEEISQAHLWKRAYELKVIDTRV